MIASLPMYDIPETATAQAAFWALIRDHLRAHGGAHGPDVPQVLTRVGDLWALWRAPDLVLAQTCGLPYRAVLHPHVTLLGTPDYGLEGCAPGYYHSVLVARDTDPRSSLAEFQGARLAISDALSQSGWGAVHAEAAGQGISLVPHSVTGGHRATARAIADNAADFGAIDALTWRLMCRHAPDLVVGLAIFGTTAPTPGLPYIAAAGVDPAPLRAALHAACAALSPTDRAILCIRDIIAIPPEAYLAVPCPPKVAGDAAAASA